MPNTRNPGATNHTSDALPSPTGASLNLGPSDSHENLTEAPTSLADAHPSFNAKGHFTSEAAFGQRVACVEVDQALIDRINANPANYYLNFHTFSFPKGAMRGQLA
jgi:hypothetical protein